MAALLLTAMTATAQQRTSTLTISVVTSVGEDLTGQPVVLEQTDFAVGYGTLKLDKTGTCTVKVYPGNHRLTVDRDGFEPVVKDFLVADGDANASVTVTLTEKTRTPFALNAAVRHDVVNGRNDVDLSWNVEAPAFFDDFESYSPFAVNFGTWTGIDADGEATAALQGSYPNRGIMQYAQIINPLTVVPTWWYDYPILRPYSGKQYVGFIRTESGRANDDWLISPVINVGTDNVLEFMAKAADRYDERFMVFVTTETSNPGVEDFTRLDKGNYESIDYREWTKFSYDLSEYAGKEIRFAIRYVSDYSRYRSFMLMIDDVFVGQPMAAAKIKRVKRSPANPYESFNLYLDGVKAGVTDGYSFTFENVAAGHHTLGVEAVYKQATSPMTTVEVDVATGSYSSVTLNVEADSKLAADNIDITLLNLDDGSTVTVTTAGGKVTLASLANGRYSAHVEEGVYEAFSKEFEVNGDTSVDIKLVDKVMTPYNITVDVADETGNATVRWNQELGFSDSFETYDDFATGRFGDWISIDRDESPVYPIALGSQTNIVTFPGSGNATNPTAIAPMVFNPLKTVPAMSPADPAIEATDGVKSVIFFSPQMARADKWLISPVVKVREGYDVSFSGKAYSSMYPESLDIYISEECSENPDDFMMLASIESLESSSWGRYSVDLDGYEGKDVRLALHYTSYDAFLAQVDEFSVGKADGAGDFIDYGNVVGYEIYLDGTKVGESSTPEFVINGVAPGEHTVGIKALYQNSASDVAEYSFGFKSGIVDVVVDTENDREIFDITGRRLHDCNAAGIYIIREGGKTFKIKK